MIFKSHDKFFFAVSDSLFFCFDHPKTLSVLHPTNTQVSLKFINFVKLLHSRIQMHLISSHYGAKPSLQKEGCCFKSNIVRN